MPTKLEDVSRVTRSHRSAGRVYDRLSAGYDRLAGGSEGRFRAMGLELLDVRAGERVLEIGSGTGEALLALRRGVGESGLALGIDLSAGMAAVASRKLQKAAGLGRARLALGDGCKIPCPANSFDAIFMSFTLELFDTPEIPLVLAECGRVLRPGGRLCTVTLSCGERRANAALGLYEWFHRILPDWVDCRPIPAGEFLRAAGLSAVCTRSGSMWGLPVEMTLAVKSGQTLAP